MRIKRDSIEILPVEVLEEVFSYLSDGDVVAAASVCPRWAGVCQRIARVKCGQRIPDDILTEILAEQEWGVVDWVNVWAGWVGSGLRSGDTRQYAYMDNQPSNITYNNPVLVSVVEGDGVYTGDEWGGLEWRQMGSRHCIRTQLGDGNVENICLIPTFGLVLVAGQNFLHFFYLDRERHYWERLGKDFQLQLSSNHHISVFGPRLCAADSDGFIKVLEIFYVGLSVRTSEVCRLHQRLPWVQWTLWREKVIALQTNGEILVLSLICPSGQLMYKSQPYHVVMYKNPCWIFRDVVFCSSLASRGLPDSTYGPHTYVYMSDLWDTRNGTGFWMVGPVDDLSDESFLEEAERYDMGITAYTNPDNFASAMRGFCLKKIYPGLNSNDDVTCITMRRRLILCGTLCGSLLIFSADSSEPGSEDGSQTTSGGSGGQTEPLKHSKLLFDSNPLVKRKVSTSPITKVDISFKDSSILLYYKVGSNSISCLALPSLLNTSHS